MANTRALPTFRLVQSFRSSGTRLIQNTDKYVGSSESKERLRMLIS